MTEAEVENWQIPAQFLKPILPGPRNLNGDIVQSLPDGLPDVEVQHFLLDCDLSETQIAESWPRFYDYLQQGKAKEVDVAYLASRRLPWYSQENRPPAPFLCTYMGRSRNGKHPFRFIWNRSRATAHNVYLMLYPKGPLREALKESPELEAEVFDNLQNISPEQFISQGRVYGGGLHKVEPKELARIPAGFLFEGLGITLRQGQQLAMFES